MIRPWLGGWITSAPLPSPLRTRFQHDIEDELSRRAAALRLKLPPATGVPSTDKKSCGTRTTRPAAWAGKIGRGRASPPLQDREPTGPAWRHGERKSPVATERRRTKVKQPPADWAKHRLPAIAAWPERMVSLDETAVRAPLTHLSGRAKQALRGHDCWFRYVAPNTSDPDPCMVGSCVARVFVSIWRLVDCDHVFGVSLQLLDCAPR